MAMCSGAIWKQHSRGVRHSEAGGGTKAARKRAMWQRFGDEWVYDESSGEGPSGSQTDVDVAFQEAEPTALTSF